MRKKFKWSESPQLFTYELITFVSFYISTFKHQQCKSQQQRLAMEKKVHWTLTLFLSDKWFMIICHTADDPSATQQTFHNIWRLLNVLHHQGGETLDSACTQSFPLLRHLIDTVLQVRKVLVLLPLHTEWVLPKHSKSRDPEAGPREGLPSNISMCFICCAVFCWLDAESLCDLTGRASGQQCNTWGHSILWGWSMKLLIDCWHTVKSIAAPRVKHQMCFCCVRIASALTVLQSQRASAVNPSRETLKPGRQPFEWKLPAGEESAKLPSYTNENQYFAT